MSPALKVAYRVISDPKLNGPGHVVTDKHLLAQELPNVTEAKPAPGPLGRWRREHHEILVSALNAKTTLEKRLCGLASAEKRFVTGRDLQGLVKWDVGTTTKRVANLGIPIHLKAIVRAAKANNRKFFIRLGKLLEEENKRLTQPATPLAWDGGYSPLHDFLFEGWVGLEEDRVAFRIRTPDGFCGEMDSLGLCFFTQPAIWEVVKRLGLVSESSKSNISGFDNFRKFLQRLNMKRASRPLIDRVETRGKIIFCTHS